MKLQRVGDYLLGEKLGEGSFAKVRVGLHVMSREKVSNFKFLEANQPSFFSFSHVLNVSGYLCPTNNYELVQQ